MFSIRLLLILIPVLPLTACLATAILGHGWLRGRSHWPAVFGIVGSFICSCLLLGEVRAIPEEGPQGVAVVETYWTWAHISEAYVQTANGVTRNLDIKIDLRADPLTAIMLVMVTFISSLVVIYASGYMHDDRGYWRFFCFVSLFVFSMTMLVSVSNFLLLFVFWEAVGACSYLLIGFWYQKEEASAAGKKAFLVNRIGDFGFTLAIFLIWINYGTLNFHDTAQVQGVLGSARISGEAVFLGGGVGTVICLLLLVGACGKSAQFPLHVWLPDAMEGPTPVSALIHAATMVTAGVYMVARCSPLFSAAPDAQLVVATIGGITALLAGLIAITQFDLKRVLAYSTISQLGYMFVALGTGSLAGITAGMFHLFTHAFFKALLFLGAGSVMHGMGNVIDMRRFRGLRHVMPTTHRTFLLGCLALAGVFPLAGFWSKDAIVGAVHDRIHELDHQLGHESDFGHPNRKSNETFHQVTLMSAQAKMAHLTALTPPTEAWLSRARAIYGWLFYVLLFSAFLTAFYTFRAFFMTFYGEKLLPAEAGDHAHESGPSMTIPLIILAVCACVVGVVLDRTGVFARFLGQTPSLKAASLAGTTTPGVFHMDVALKSTFAALLGIGLAGFLYLGHFRGASALAGVLSFRWFNWLGVLSPYKLSHNKFYFDEIYAFLFVLPTRGLAWLCMGLDRWLIDGTVNLCGRLPVWFGALMRSLQTGLIPFYGLAMILGTVILIIAKVRWGAS